MTTIKVIGGASATLFLILVGVTWVALELNGVAIVHTSDRDGAVRETHVWFVESDAQLLLEAGNATSPWVLALANGETLGLTRAGAREEFGFQIAAEPEKHTEIRSLMREKYGWRDWWVDLLFDTSGSRMVVLAPLPG